MRRIIVFAFVGCSFFAFGQNSIPDQRFVRFKAYQAVREYANYTTLKTATAEEIFKGLFSENAYHVNDILPMNKSNTSIKIDDYVDIPWEIVDVRKSTIEIDIESISLQPTSQGSNHGWVDVEAKKIFTYLEGYESRRAYSDTLDFLFQMEYTDTVVKIKNVILNEPAVKYFFIDIKNKGSRKNLDFQSDQFNSISINRKLYELPSTGIISIQSLPEHEIYKIVVPNSREYIGRKTIRINDYGGEEVIQGDISFTNYKEVRLRLKRFYLNQNNSFSETSQNNFYGNGFRGELEETQKIISLNIGTVLIRQSRVPFEFRIEGGLFNRMNDYQLSLPFYTEIFASIDPDNHEYTRIVSLTDFEESGTLEFLGLSFRSLGYIDLESWIPKLSVFTSFMYSHILNVKSSYNSYSNTLYSGQYGPEYNSVLIKNNGIYDFGNFDISSSAESEESFISSFYGYQLGVNYEVRPRIELEAFIQFDGSDSDSNVNFDKITRIPSHLKSMYFNNIDSRFNWQSIGFSLNYYLK